MDDRQPLLKESALPHGGVAGTIKLVLICGGGGDLATKRVSAVTEINLNLGKCFASVIS